MATQGSPNQKILVKYAVLVGLTPLIPLPLLDDLAQHYFERRMLEKLVIVHALALSPAQIDELAAPPPMAEGWIKGCLLNLLLYPIKKIFRKIFFFLEIKRTIDLVAQTYAKGHLIDGVLSRKLCAPLGPHAPGAIRAASERALARVGVSPIELAIRNVFSGSKALILRVVEALIAALRRLSGRPSREQLAEAVRSVEEQGNPDLQGLDDQVQQSLQAVPVTHFERLDAAMTEELGKTPPR